MEIKTTKELQLHKFNKAAYPKVDLNKRWAAVDDLIEWAKQIKTPDSSYILAQGLIKQLIQKAKVMKR